MWLAALVSIASGLVGGVVWIADLSDRSDGDDLRWGWWHNPFLRFDPFSELYLDISMWVLLGCAAASGLGGLLLLARNPLGRSLVTGQAMVAIATNGVVVFFIALMALGILELGWTREALALRLGSISVNLALWKVLTTRAVADWMSGPSRTRPTPRSS